ncbi:histone-lysine N-methyltransferase, H3 lysine-9 specific SUVH1-like [Andrographis paniculata]|uniref:histone-lysine N-methyltransferase, H3 lysine-9 specific SUVH1-like n=1 Tax=Andrographis paniculata TaxID=175694 RepID=UPI0021E75D99|nr:histone-lysine N-methyltransferase, H3 lysine-9 specific SUVH1-like [Andrographis paniculata]XP_051138779.1 histone-lysine N-methyltransferase, H3 lysine-9 specific SUVH1-like [Andrographis paniculata]XP_051138780.1 histone-lysine N-methyltransferase, H3 lysine-9 specific SUVH1-like [Andrographis paniculata]XP_051138782.1 histone-lysine N-methyltransferase, H3 lysine-9 specific SUVH1-like [Andrographis paniculata]
MDRDLGSEPTPIDKSTVLDVKPLRFLVPIFPNAASASTPQPTPFTFTLPSGPFPPGVLPFYPFLVQDGSQRYASGAQNPNVDFGVGGSIPAPVPLNSFKTPSTSHPNGGVNRRKRTHRGTVDIEDDDYSFSPNQSGQNGSASGFSAPGNDFEIGSTGKRKGGRPRKIVPENGEDTFDVTPIMDSFLAVFKIHDFEEFRRSIGDTDAAQTILLVYDLIRRRILQLEEAKGISSGVSRRPDLKSGAALMAKRDRTNKTRPIGRIPGIEVGDIFFFRIELCVVGLHAPSMAGIDYMSFKDTGDDEPLAVSIVSSGGYENDGDDADVLVYSGQGGVQRKDGRMFDQKLERGNLALQKSLTRGNDVRVIRGIRDNNNLAGKIYVYDGEYRIQESWAEKHKLGCNVFKYKLVRVPGQPEAFSLWKRIQQWRDGTDTRNGVIIPDLTSGAESQPVVLVNDVDDERGPAYFAYAPRLKYSKPFVTSNFTTGCQCLGGCQPGDTACPCVRKNDGALPYTSLGIILTNKYPIHECGMNCACPPDCRNRTSQAGLKIRLEVFKTKDRGWGLRSWDPIRAGSFICEYAGDVVDVVDADEYGNGNDDNYVFDATRRYKQLESLHDDDSAGVGKSPFPLVISAKENGNVARFMNHSCSPNVFWQPVVCESNNDSYVHVAFFAIRHIPPMQELTYDYGMVAPEKVDKGKKNCLCGSTKCRGYFY